jgi:CBS domain-containing protein
MKWIKDLMTRDVEIAQPDTTLLRAASIMKARNIGSLPVCKGRRLVGILTDRDIVVRSVVRGDDPSQVMVADIMTGEFVWCRPQDSIGTASRLMHDHQLRRLPVLDPSGDLVGYLTLARVAREESSLQVGRVLKGVSQPTAPRSMASYRHKRRRKSG